MAEPDRTAFARKHAAWLIPGFVLVLGFGLWRGNLWATLAGAGGVAWVVQALWTGR